jgi:hypothetical protein
MTEQVANVCHFIASLAVGTLEIPYVPYGTLATLLPS